jgi:uncharacterized protein YkwD
MRRLGAKVTGLCVAFLTIAAPTAAADCTQAGARPDEISVSDYGAALLCVVNETRREWGRGELEPQRNLARAGEWQADDMVAKRYVSHTSPDGSTPGDRLDRANFIPRSDRWRAGENLAAGHADSGTPAAIVYGWMQSREHRSILLDPGFTMAGVGVMRGWPAPNGFENDVMTVALELGWRTFVPRRSE